MDAIVWQPRNIDKQNESMGPVLALAGVIAPLVFWATLILAGVLRQEYNPIRQYGSELGIGPNAWLMNGAFVTFGILEMIFAFGLESGMRRGGEVSKLGPGLVGVAAFAMMLVGFFPMAIGRRTIAGSIHAHAAQLLFVSMALAFFVLARRMSRDSRWEGYAGISVLVGAISLGLFVLYQWGGSMVSSWIGLEQRMLLAATLGWLEVIAIRLLILSGRSPMELESRT